MHWMVLLSLLVACTGPKKVPAPAAQSLPAAPQPAATPTAPQVRVKTAPLPRPGEYEVTVEWEAGGLFVDQWWVLRTIDDSTTVVAQSDAHVTAFVDGPVGAGTAIYQVTALVDGVERSIGAAAARIPVDAVLKAGVHTWEEQRWGRVFLEKDAVLRFGVRSLLAHWIALHSDGGRIEAFGAEPAADQTPGRDAGNVDLVVDRAQGDLVITAMGERGGKGAKGGVGSAGAPGTDAVPGVYATRFKLGHMPSISQYFGQDVVRAPIPATPAGNGGKGGAGAAGAPGGNSGSVSLKIAQTEGFWPRVFVDGGRGGEGGEGGDGGPGGKVGEPGQVGPEGENGKPGEVKIELEGRSFSGDSFAH